MINIGLNASEYKKCIRGINIRDKFKEMYPVIFDYLNFPYEKWLKINNKHNNWFGKLPKNVNSVKLLIKDYTLPLILMESKDNLFINNIRKLFISSVNNIFYHLNSNPSLIKEISKTFYNVMNNDTSQCFDYIYEILTLNYYLVSGYKIANVNSKIFGRNDVNFTKKENDVEFTLTKNGNYINLEVKTRHISEYCNNTKFIKDIKSDINRKYNKKIKNASLIPDFTICHIINPTEKSVINYNKYIEYMCNLYNNINPLQLSNKDIKYNNFAFIPTEKPCFYSFTDNVYLDDYNTLHIPNFNF